MELCPKINFITSPKYSRISPVVSKYFIDFQILFFSDDIISINAEKFLLYFPVSVQSDNIQCLNNT